MKYWFTIKEALPEETAQNIWKNIVSYKTNMTVLFDKAYVYGDADKATISLIDRYLSKTGFAIERG